MRLYQQRECRPDLEFCWPWTLQGCYEMSWLNMITRSMSKSNKCPLPPISIRCFFCSFCFVCFRFGVRSDCFVCIHLLLPVLVGERKKRRRKTMQRLRDSILPFSLLVLQTTDIRAVATMLSRFALPQHNSILKN